MLWYVSMRIKFGFNEDKDTSVERQCGPTYQEVQGVLEAEATDIELQLAVHENACPDLLAPSADRNAYTEEAAVLRGRTDELQRIGLRIVKLYQQNIK